LSLTGVMLRESRRQREPSPSARGETYVKPVDKNLGGFHRLAVARGKSFELADREARAAVRCEIGLHAARPPARVRPAPADDVLAGSLASRRSSG
jgi:hypothetical protein